MNLPRLLSSLVLALLLAAPVAAQNSAEFFVGTWNIEFLGASPTFRRDTPPRTDADVEKIGAKIRALNVCVLGVQEICGEAPLEQVCAAAGANWSFVLGTSGKWSDGKTQQGVGLLYDTDVVELLHAEERNDFPSERGGVNVFHRKPVTACFRHKASGCDFRVVVVHLKAGRKDKDRLKRRIEATHLREWLHDLQQRDGEDQDIVLLGDFNCTYGDKPEQVLEAGGGLQYLDHQQVAPTILWFDEPIDQIVVAEGCREVQRDSLRVHGVRGEQERLAWRRTYSDHFPVTCRVLAAGDDDPKATFSRGPNSQFLPVSRRAATARANASAPSGAPGFAVGDRVRVLLDPSGYIDGELLAPLPEGPGGWVQVRTPGDTVAIPLRQVRQVRK